MQYAETCSIGQKYGRYDGDLVNEQDEDRSKIERKNLTTLERLVRRRRNLAIRIAKYQILLARLEDVIATAQDKPELLAAYDTVADVINHY